MLDSRVTGEVLAEARRSGAKVILAGDDRQLASIERGGLFTELRKTHDAAEITEVTRQKVDWQREAARDLAEGRFDTAVAAYDRHGAITWTGDGEAARAALVEQWKADTLADPTASRFVFAYTNADVSQINAELRQVRRERGELSSPDVRLETKHGAADFAVGDRVQFTDTDKRRHIYNGNAGVITGIDARTGKVTARLDAAAGAPGREVTWLAAGVRGVPARLRGDDLQGPGQDAGPYVSAAHAALAGGGELRGADPAARKRSAVRGRGHGARRLPTRAADGARRGAGGNPLHGPRQTSCGRSCSSAPGGAEHA